MEKNKVLHMELHHGSKDFNSEGGKPAEAEAIYEHYDFVRGSLVNDIALIRLKKPVKLDDFTNVVCLPERDERVPSGTEAFVAGWGYMNENAFWTQDLAREVMVPIVPQEWCDEAYTRKINEETEVCAGFKAGGKGSQIKQNRKGGHIFRRLPGRFRRTAGNKRFWKRSDSARFSKLGLRLRARRQIRSLHTSRRLHRLD